jgi:hypothetical protein
MLKILFWLLLAINGALFALGQGFLEKHPAQHREPQRLARQLHPEQLLLSPPAAVSAVQPEPAQAVAALAPIAPTTSTTSIAPTTSTAAVAADKAPLAAAPPVAAAEPVLACVEIGNFDQGEARLFRNRLAAARLNARSTQSEVQEVASYMVYIPAQDGREGAERRAAELRRLGLTDFYILPESSPIHDAISLGLFKTEAAAKAHVGQLIARGIRSARITERTAGASKVVFRLQGLDAADQAGLAALASAFPSQSRRDCRN